MKPSQYPEIYRPARTSAYRKRIAAFGKPLPEKIRKTMEMGESLFTGVAEGAKTFVDLEVFQKNFQRYLQLATSQDLAPPGKLTGDIATDTVKLFEGNGVFFDCSGHNLFIGPLLDKREIAGVRVYTAAIKNEITGGAYLPKRFLLYGFMPPMVVIDAVSMLENAATKINLIRFLEMDGPSSVLFLEDTPDKEKFRKIIRLVKGKNLSHKDYRKALRAVNTTGDFPLSLTKAHTAVYLTRLMAQQVQISGDQDEIQHTIKLCNIMARSLLISHLATHAEFELLKKTANIDERDMKKTEWLFRKNRELMTFISWLADIAYGSILVRLADIQFHAFSGGLDARHETFRKHGINPMLHYAGLMPASTAEYENSYYKITRSADKLRDAAKRVLDEGYEASTGKTYTETHPDLIACFGEVNSMDFITREHLPATAQIWKERYLEE